MDPSLLLRHLQRLYETRTHADCAIVVDGRRFPAHRVRHSTRRSARGARSRRAPPLSRALAFGRAVMRRWSRQQRGLRQECVM